MRPSLVVNFEYPFSKGGDLHVDFLIPIDRPSISVIFGPSGSGKSSVLHCLAGIEKPNCGRIRFGNIEWFNRSKKIDLQAQKRSVGLLFQDYPLFTHLNVIDNITYGLKNLSKEDKAVHAKTWCDRFHLKNKERRFPHELSGGEKQRVALAQMCSASPDLLLLDEPFSALDLYTRSEIQRQLMDWIHKNKATAILVTHDLAEALALGDQLIILSEGRILQQGNPMDIFSRPALPAVAKIVGVENLLPGKVIEVDNDLLTISLGKAVLIGTGSLSLHQNCFVAIRAEEVVLEKGPPNESSARNRLKGRVQDIVSRGAQTEILIDCGFLLTTRITQRSLHDLSLKPGMEISAVIKASAIHILSAL